MRMLKSPTPRGWTFAEIADTLESCMDRGDGVDSEVDCLLSLIRLRADGSRRVEIARCPSREICPRCGSEDMAFPAVSRIDNETKVCPQCGEVEAFEFSMGPRRPVVKFDGRLIHTERETLYDHTIAGLALTLYAQRRAAEQLRERIEAAGAKV